jgi:hypothetical protein
MKRTIVALAALLLLATIATSRPVSARRHGEGAAVFHLVEATVREIQLALQTGLITSEQLVEMVPGAYCSV